MTAPGRDPGREPRRWLEDEEAEPGVRALLEAHDAQSKPGARERVWQSLDVHERTHAFWIYAVPAGVLAAVLLAVFSRSPEVSLPAEPHASPAIAESTGDSTYRVETRPDQGRRLVFDRQALDLEPLSALEVTTESPLAVRLDRGALDAHLLRHPPKTPVTVHAGRYTVVGTSFALSRVGPRDIRVRARAAVRIETEDAAPRALREGEEFDSALERQRAPSPERSEPEKAALASKPSPAEPRREVSTKRAEAKTRRSPAPMKAAPPSRTKAVPPSQTKAVPPSRTKAVPQSRTKAVRSAPAEGRQAELYERAKSERGDAALALFDRAADLPGPLAELAAYRAARVQMSRGRYQSAAERFESLVTRFPSGTLGREAGLSALECRIQEGQLGRAKAQLDAFLARYPETERGSDLRFLRAELNRRSGRYRDAIRDYRAVDGPRAAQAIYLTAWCHSEMGESKPAKKALSLYLERFPEGPHAAAARAFIDGRRTGRLSEEI